MAKRNLLKEAIADAKTVKSMAIRNAKNALTEAFTPQLTSMLSAQLQEMEDEDEETVEAMVTEEDDEEINVDEILSELDDEESEEQSENLDEADDESDDLEEVADESDDAEEGEDDDNEDEEEEQFDSEDFTEDDLKTFIEDVITNMDLDSLGDDEEEDGLEGVEDMEGLEGEDDEEVDLEELLAEIDEMSGENEEETIDEGFMDKIVKAVNRLGSSGAVEDLIKINLPKVVAAAKKTGKLSSDFEPSQETVDSLTLRAKDDGGTGNIIFKDGKLAYQPGSESKGTAQASTHESLETELHEAYGVIKSLRKDLNEINLLNAKLLYTNKIFKGKKSLNESQKVKVLETFDKATTVKEVRLVYETLNTGLISSKKPINEGAGGSSRVMGSTQRKNPVIEVEDHFKRMNEIAFYDVKH